MMAILAKTQEYLVESENGHLTIARYSDGHCLAFDRGAAAEFKRCLKTHSAERVIRTFLNIGREFTWQPLYKPARMPR